MLFIIQNQHACIVTYLDNDYWTISLSLDSEDEFCADKNEYFRHVKYSNCMSHNLQNLILPPSLQSPC